jgi:murein DD-endopeptidase MepM/ murein hydrolase activator NlpD
MIEQSAKLFRKEKQGNFAFSRRLENGNFGLGFGAALLVTSLALSPISSAGESSSPSRAPTVTVKKAAQKTPAKASRSKASKKSIPPSALKASLDRKGGKPKPRPGAPPKTARVNPSKPVLPPLPPPDEEEGAILPASPAFVGLDLPTANQALFSRNQVADFYQPTSSGRIISAGFGCVRNPNFWGSFTRFHEGIDIRSVQRDEDGEPRDPVRSMGEGRVAYANRDTGKSNYGKYVVVEHDLFGPRFYSLYAHLASVDDGIEPGQSLSRSARLGIMGRTSNEFRIDREHAHLHFEVDLMANDRYARWSKKRGQGEPNHGLFNGANLVGVDPVRFMQFLQVNPDLGIGDFIAREPVAFRVLALRQGDFSWVRRYPFTLSRKPTEADKAWEISMTYYGLPIRVTPRRREEIPETAWKALKAGVWPLTFANAPLLRANTAAEVVIRKGDRWRLGDKGREWMSLLMF